jgi:hypothetical protein
MELINVNIGHENFVIEFTIYEPLLYIYILEPHGRGKSSKFYLELSGQAKYVCFRPTLYSKNVY